MIIMWRRVTINYTNSPKCSGRGKLENQYTYRIEEKAPDTFEVLHYAALAVLKKGDERYGI